MRNQKLGIIVLLVLLIMPVVLATTTTINVKTLANHDVILKTLDPDPNEGESNVLEYFKKSSDANGQVSFVSHTNKPQINILIIVEKDGNRIEINGKTLQLFEKKPTGAIITLEVKEKPPEPEVNETESNETEEVEATANETIETAGTGEAEETEEQEIEEKKETGKLTGAFISIGKAGKAIVTSKVTYYMIGGIFIIGVFVFVIFIARKKLKGRAGHYINFKIKDGKVTESVSKQISDKRLAAAEKKLEEAKKELDYIKNRKNRLEEAKERFEESKKELERLERD